MAEEEESPPPSERVWSRERAKEVAFVDLCETENSLLPATRSISALRVTL